MASKYNTSTEGDSNQLEQNGKFPGDDVIEQTNESYTERNENYPMESKEETQREYEKRIEQIYQEQVETLGINNGEIEGEKDRSFAKFMKKKENKATDFSQVQLHDPACVCVSKSHKLVFVSTKGNSSITMLDLNGESKGKITSKELKSPWGMAIKDDTIYVTDIEARSVYSFSITEKTLIEISQANFVQPRQLAINCANEIWVADDLGNEIAILDEKLRKIETIKDDKIKFPMDIKFTYAQAYILSRDEGNVISVHIFEQNTKEYTKIIIHPNNKDPIDCNFFHIQTNLILIPDAYSKFIIFYNLSGEKKGTLDAKISATPLCLDVLDDDIYILYKLDKAQLKII